MFGFSKDENTQPMQAPPGTPDSPPVDQVIQLRNQGLSNNQIIQSLQNNGYDSNLIFDALNQADIKGGVEQVPMAQGNMPPDALQNPMPDPSMPPAMQEVPNVPPPMGSQTGIQMESSAQSQQLDTGSLERIEEIAEAIIDEKWNDIVKSINKIIDWKDRTDTSITKIQQQILDLQQNFDNLTKGVLGKISDYDRNLSDIGSEIKAMEKVFQKVLPTLTENVHTLERLTKDLKKKR